ncbi:MAG: hypothetical protein CMD28_03860 [Flavobacteriales bacterium]|nr:hypothetical protein [Flavobacteriales bacterium]|tara:strand:- start:940 stop:1527 length:588 start_codon:yes stop_codon:yes gene_type:complete
MMQRLWVLLLLLFSVSYEVSSQGKLIIVDLEVVGYDTVISSDLPEVEILDFKSQDEKNNYFILKKRVLKVYPYAVVAKKKIQEIKLALDTIPKRRKKKRYTREMAKWLKEQYTDRLKDLTISEGKILVKLIYRETNSTSYKILKSYRGSFNALFWQIMAKIWDNNLKTGYDPINIREDMLIEYILIEDGNEEFLG